MSEPDAAANTHWAYYTLGALKAANVTGIEFWCVARPRCCSNRYTIWIDDAIARYGATTPLIMLARRARCRQCGGRGCHIQPVAPLAYGMPGYFAEQEKGGLKWP